jgi:energy-coupling factor transport system permease protein
MNPLAKLLTLVIFSVLVLMISDLAFMLVIVAVVMSSKQWHRASNTLTRGAVSFAVAIFVAQILFNHSGDTIANLSVLRITAGGVESGLAIAGKFLALIGMSWIFVATTRPTAMSASLISAGVPYRYAYLPSLAMHFVPTFQFELASVREAQVTRGLRLDKSLRGIIGSARYTIMPMLLSAMSKVNSLASSMTGRGFGAYPTRTLMHPQRMTSWDVASVFAALALAVAVVLANHYVNIHLLGPL